jgi:hypothetical protein
VKNWALATGSFWVLGEPFRSLELPDSTGRSVGIEIEWKDRTEKKDRLCGSRSRS